MNRGAVVVAVVTARTAGVQVAIAVFIAAWRAGKRPPEQLSAARHVAREQALPETVQAELAALNQRKDNGQLSEMEYEQLRAKVLSR